ncbi:zinc finger CCCH domain-containing protein 13 isoform X1 [Tripterygium wilfordii]|uniref:Zinc finger CCCH domain-containing protein 13 isoform X1 n=1 Tax=Tripterygium wilfordii TaxID=458696 RepID=A0A7J7DZP7_TRIWF|nr:zinc finger CCCH domain-containing protein 13-like [Tripterygium wilfordii]XP_038722156.1 zinc finger CCCH domain-containing protein 13-like [Tripterygium wilfordii]KAF5751751.1 zinc finger CCCH domain-containing protein 13 isoform X1 [Tripterygium wilfordii]
MSGTPRRSQEEGGHSSSSRHPHEDAGAYPKLTSPLSTEYHPPYEMGQDYRAAKVTRPDSRDVDRSSPMHSTYRMPLSSNDSHMDAHPAVPENRAESRDPNREHRADNRDQRLEARELYGEAKRESQSAKGDKEAKFDGRGDDGKEIKYDRETYNDPKGDGKTEKDGLEAASSHLNWKEPKEYHRGKRYSESPGGNIDPWHNSRGSSQGPTDIGKECPAAEERDYVESNEAVGENKVDSKGEDRFKDKDRKRKEVKHREWGDRDKERSERKDSSREGERWERERKDISKDKERLKEREKDHVKREKWNNLDKENLHNEKESGNVSVRMSEQENLVSEQKKQKDFESWKNADRDRKKEKDCDVEGDRPEKRSRCYDKESDDGCVDGEGASERERDVFNYGVQQKKRMLRSRGSPQVVNREPRFGARSQENEGSQGKSEVSSVIYKIGECMEDLIKLWKEYESAQADKNVESSQNGPTLEIRIPTEHVTAINRQVRGGQLWGTDIYTYDSDLVAVLMHTGYCRPTASPPPGAIQELRAVIRVLPPQDSYTSTLRNNVRSRAWGAAIGCSYRVEQCCIVKKGGGTIDLEPCLTHTSTVEPTLAPVAVERTMTTRAAALNALRQQRFVREVTIQYNLCNEPWIKYSISVVADKGLKKPLYTSARLKKGEVLYLETHSCRYELCFTGEKMVKSALASQNHEGETEKPPNNHSLAANGDKNDSENIMIDAFRWSRCKTPLPQKFMRSVGIPLPHEYVEVLEDNLDWEDVQWSQTGVWIAGKEYALARVHFLSMN